MYQCFVRGFVWVAWENTRHFATSPLVSPRNDVWGTSAEIPYWWRAVLPRSGRSLDWSCCEGHLSQPIRSTAQIWVLTRNQYGLFSALVPQTSFDGKTSVVIANYRLFFQAGVWYVINFLQTEKSELSVLHWLTKERENSFFIISIYIWLGEI